MKKNTFSTSAMVITALMAAIICVMGPFTIPIGPIPISLATFAIYLSAVLLGLKKGIIACILYLMIGFAGVPVFSGFSAGPAKLLGPTGGYLIGYVFLIGITGWFAERFSGKKSINFRGICLVGMMLGTIVCYIIGTMWLAYQMDMTFGAAFMIGVVPFVLGDVGKMLIIVWIGPIIKVRLNRARVFI